MSQRIEALPETLAAKTRRGLLDFQRDTLGISDPRARANAQAVLNMLDFIPMFSSPASISEGAQAAAQGDVLGALGNNALGILDALDGPIPTTAMLLSLPVAKRMKTGTTAERAREAEAIMEDDPLRMRINSVKAKELGAHISPTGQLRVLTDKPVVTADSAKAIQDRIDADPEKPFSMGARILDGEGGETLRDFVAANPKRGLEGNIQARTAQLDSAGEYRDKAILIDPRRQPEQNKVIDLQDSLNHEFQHLAQDIRGDFQTPLSADQRHANYIMDMNHFLYKSNRFDEDGWQGMRKELSRMIDDAMQGDPFAVENIDGMLKKAGVRGGYNPFMDKDAVLGIMDGIVDRRREVTDMLNSFGGVGGGPMTKEAAYSAYLREPIEVEARAAGRQSTLGDYVGGDVLYPRAYDYFGEPATPADLVVSRSDIIEGDNLLNFMPFLDQKADLYFEGAEPLSVLDRAVQEAAKNPIPPRR